MNYHEPWSVARNEYGEADCGTDDSYVIKDVGGRAILVVPSHVLADRIVACVNATRGISGEILYTLAGIGVPFGEALKRL